MESIHITLDTQKVTKSQNIKVTQSDSAVQFVVKVQRNGKDDALPAGTVYTLTSLRLDGIAVLSPEPGVVTADNEITFKLGTTETEIMGSVRASVQMYQADGRVSTLAFMYTVLRDLSTDYIPSESEKTLIESVLVDGPVVIQEARDSIDLAKSFGIGSDARIVDTWDDADGTGFYSVNSEIGIHIQRSPDDAIQLRFDRYNSYFRTKNTGVWDGWVRLSTAFVVGNNIDLMTDDKSTIVAAINEIHLRLASLSADVAAVNTVEVRNGMVND